MTTPANARWLEWCKRLQAIAQNGITFAQDAYDLERYQDLRRIVAEMLAEGSGQDQTFIPELLQNDTGYCTPKVHVRGAVIRQIIRMFEHHRQPHLPTNFDILN